MDMARRINDSVNMQKEFAAKMLDVLEYTLRNTSTRYLYQLFSR
jgi:hypothetical protein